MSEAIASLLAQLIAIPSVNPELGGTGEAELAQFVAAELRKTGAEVGLQPVNGERCNVFARLGDDSEPAILLEAHLDTVAPGERWRRPPFAAAEEEGRIYGLGACDTKASLATFLTVFAEFAREPGRLAQPLIFAATVDEEVGQQGAYALMRQQWHIGAAVTGEPTLCRVVAAHKGYFRFTVRSQGRAAHSSTPELGDNAILRMGPVLQQLERYAKGLAQRTPHPLLGNPTVNVGTITGGVGVNSVPDTCTIRVDRRTTPGESRDAVRNEIAALLQPCPNVEWDDGVERPPLATPVDSPVVRSLLRALEDTGTPGTVEAVPYLTNAVAYAAAGIPTVVFGPGDIAQAHRPDEYVTVTQLQRAHFALRCWLERGLG